MYTKDITLEFINNYKILENLRDSNFSLFETLRNQNQDLYEEFRNTRNVLAHNINSDGSYPILVSKELLDNLKHQIELLSKDVTKIMTTSKYFTAARLSTPIYQVIEFMNSKNYSHIPVLDDNGIVSHVVSLDSIINILATNKGFNLDVKTTVEDYKEFFELENNSDQYYLFMASNSLAYSAKEKMQQRIDNKKCGIIFITKNGTKDERLLGIISSYDLIGL